MLPLNSKCLETRARDGMRWRRYRTPSGRVITTYELPEAVLRGAAPTSKVLERLTSWARGEKQRERKAKVLARISEGVKPEAIGHEVGLTATEVQRLRRNRNA